MKRSIVTILFLFFCVVSFAQTRTIDSTMVTFYPTNFDSITLNNPYYLDTNTFHANNFDLLGHDQTLYSTLSNIGLAHKAMRFSVSPRIGFDMEIPSFTNYIKTEKDLKTYLSLLPYSEIRYVMTFGDKEQHLNFRFGRQFAQGLYLSFEYNINYSPASFDNNKAENNYFWINALYTTNDQRYRALAYWFRNKIDVQENGGIIYDSIYYNHIESDNTAILTNLSNANNFIKVSGAGFQHYFNILPQYKTIIEEIPKDTIRSIDTLNLIVVDSLNTIAIDSLSTIAIDSLNLFANDSLNIAVTDSLSIDSIATPDSLELLTKEVSVERKFTFGRINHSFAYQRNQLFYNETSASLPFYAPFDTLLSANTTDTTIVHAIRNSLTWNSLGYKNYDNNVPFYLYAGINYDFYKIKHFDYIEKETLLDQTHSQAIFHGGTIVNLFGLTTITGHAQLVFLGYHIGDFDFRGQWKQRFGKRDHGFGKDVSLCFDIDLKRQSPTWFETKYYSNHFRWENDFHAATYLTMNLFGQYKTIRAGVKNTTINDYIYFNKEARPTQHDGIVSISEIYGIASTTLWRFQLEGFFAFNFVSNEEVLHLPSFQSRLKFSFAQPIFKKAAILQPSITVQYFTKYLADAYMPALRTFYLQDDVLVGNYPFIDLALAINVKKADIYVMYSNMFLLSGNYNSFIAPHYPMRDSKIFLGINWRLFN